MAVASGGDRGAVSVTLEFDHEGEQFTATRSYAVRKGAADDLRGEVVDEELTVEYIDEQGNYKRRPNPENTLRRILPERLRDIFFFDGETINELTQTDSQDRIQDAIRNIMGLEILERSIRHLEHVEGEFEDEMNAHGSEELSELVDRKQSLDAEIDSIETQLQTTERSLVETESELDSVEARQEELEGSHELQQEREDLREERQTVTQRIEDINDAIRQTISDDGHLVFALPAIEETAQMLREKKQKGEIPSEIKGQFVDELLELGECICGRPLVEGSEPFAEVEGWKQRAGSSELEQVAMQIAGRLTEMGEGQEELFATLESTLAERSEQHDRLERINGRLDDISTALSEKDTEKIGQLETRRVELSERVTELNQNIGGLERELSDLDERRETVETEISEAREENQLAERANRRRLAAQQLRERLEGLFQRYQDQVRQRVNERVNEIFTEIIAKEYYAQIADDYSLRILKDVDSTEAVSVAKSTGERQVASLSFIASLVSLAREQHESEDESNFFTGGIYPTLMDSPYGYLDPTYQRKVSRVLPKMSEQVVVFVTQSQWSEAVESELDAVSGYKYHLEYDNPATGDGVQYEATRIQRQQSPTGGVS
jgi:DNA sulfur modification protein DndD